MTRWGGGACNDRGGDAVLFPNRFECGLCRIFAEAVGDLCVACPVWGIGFLCDGGSPCGRGAGEECVLAMRGVGLMFWRCSVI